MSQTSHLGLAATVRSVETGHDPTLASQVRKVLLRLAKYESDLAADEAAHVPYWEPCPSSVSGRRAAAQALLREADALVAAARPVDAHDVGGNATCAWEANQRLSGPANRQSGLDSQIE